MMAAEDAEIPPWQRLPRALVSDFVNDTSHRELAAVNARMWENEWVCWATRPQAQLWAGGSAPQFVVGLVVLTFLLFITWKVASLGERMQMELWINLGSPLASFICSSLPFWCLGLYFLVSPWLRVAALRRTLYIVTNQRAISTRSGLFSRKWKWWLLTPRMYMICEVAEGRPGNILFSKYRVERNESIHHHEGFLFLSNLKRARRELGRVAEANRGRS